MMSDIRKVPERQMLLFLILYVEAKVDFKEQSGTWLTEPGMGVGEEEIEKGCLMNIEMQLDRRKACSVL